MKYYPCMKTRFGLPEEEDNRRLLKQLKNCKKQPNESVRLHAAKWEHLLSLISVSELIKTDCPSIPIFTYLCLVLTYQLSEVINQAINLEVRAKLLEEPETIMSYFPY
ncbi:hypothetical protein RO3G_15587 [Rhizopus delemar RA 99-880]|uniref:Uncharacterized protein n=1 Tax=Rhizopus delemar (strain RA 99-880 / ATCC MYA-4621 / FGSC 9543 / NRRL 43880) TaxID=246409 RepID=I1CQZ6_RHIO9|nr:hypothetical protein RO3G_15587 [Rhizopus delemar RA 99-880]|eukprot:EIE90876.1 hypothetical protein RO3G_15587 [Rhizopus delemar RA 99-880]